MQRAARKRQAGFSLVEMLAVIGIMVVLASLVFVAVRKALVRATNVSILTEMKAMESALMRYKEIHQSFPPCLGDSTIGGGIATNGIGRPGRQNRFVYHMRLGWPEVRNNGNYSAWLNMRNFIYANYQVRLADDSLIYLDLNNMDQAEALVFWLGGFPTPINPAGGNKTPLGNRKLFGFHRQMINPFQVDVPAGTSPDLAMQTRWLPWEHYGFDFDETRLRDADNDGWYEYVPRTGDYNDNMAKLPPYVYFDSDLYTIGQWGAGVASPYLGYPTAGNGWSVSAPIVSALTDQWGTAVPFATFVDVKNQASPIQWVNGSTFQIVCAGQDLTYSDPTTAAKSMTQPRIPTYPTGNVISPASSLSSSGLDDFERDNLTNFTSGTLADETSAGS